MILLSFDRVRIHKKNYCVHSPFKRFAIVVRVFVVRLQLRKVSILTTNFLTLVHHGRRGSVRNRSVLIPPPSPLPPSG